LNPDWLTNIIDCFNISKPTGGHCAAFWFFIRQEPYKGKL
jgi:hypothetical protein